MKKYLVTAAGVLAVVLAQAVPAIAGVVHHPKFW